MPAQGPGWYRLPSRHPAGAYVPTAFEAFAPQQMRALLGENSRSLQQTDRVRGEEAIEMLALSGWLDGWK